MEEEEDQVNRDSHTELLQQILVEEEELIGLHRQKTDSDVDIVKKSMNLLY